MATQILSDPTAQQSVMNSLFTAFAGFTAFGAAIVAVVASGGAVQKMANRLASRAEREDPGATWCRLLDPLVIALLTALICLVVLGSGAGLLLSFLWLHAAGSGGWNWAYGVSVDLFECEVASMTLVTFVAVIAAAVTSVRKADPNRGVTARGQDRDGPAGASLLARQAEADRLSRGELRRPLATTRALAGGRVTHSAASGKSPVQAVRTRSRNYAESGCTIGQTGPLAVAELNGCRSLPDRTSTLSQPLSKPAAQL
jgi:hypothetical protein